MHLNLIKLTFLRRLQLGVRHQQLVTHVAAICQCYLTTLLSAKFIKRYECAALVEWQWQEKTELLEGKLVPVLQRPLRTPHELVWNWSRSSAMQTGELLLGHACASLKLLCHMHFCAHSIIIIAVEHQCLAFLQDWTLQSVCSSWTVRASLYTWTVRIQVKSF